MAEAIVDGTSPMTRFFCHECSVEIEHLKPDYTCPRCSSGFIEELEVDSSNGACMDMEDQNTNDTELDETADDLPETVDMPVNLLRAVMSGNPARLRDPPERDRSIDYGIRTVWRTVNMDQPLIPRHTSSRNQQQQQGLPPHIDSLIQDLFINLTGIGVGLPQGQVLGQPIFDVGLVLANPGDYVWGQTGLDSIVTQLLNQMDGTGPPPLPQKQIDKIPIAPVSQTQVDCKLQCSVCWEDFILEEPVRQLPCQHVYHSPCIIPWLELHGTCPICRQSLGDQTTIVANQDTVGPSLAALFRAANESRTSSASLGNSSRNNSPS